VSLPSNKANGWWSDVSTKGWRVKSEYQPQCPRRDWARTAGYRARPQTTYFQPVTADHLSWSAATLRRLLILVWLTTLTKQNFNENIFSSQSRSHAALSNGLTRQIWVRVPFLKPPRCNCPKATVANALTTMILQIQFASSQFNNSLHTLQHSSYTGLVKEWWWWRWWWWNILSFTNNFLRPTVK
jgi:ribosomal protein L34